MIRYDKKLNQEMNRIIRNFNQKVKRLEKEGREYIPDTVTKRGLKEDVYTRSELMRKLKELQRFSRRGVEDVITTKGGIKITKYELSNIKRESKRIKANLTREINRLKTSKPKIFGKEQAVTFAQMGDSDYINLVARRNALNKNIYELTKEGYERYTKLVQKSGRNLEYMNSVFKDNYFDMLTDLAYYSNYDEVKLAYLKSKLMELKPNDFLKVFKEDKSIRAILDYYPVITNSFNTIDTDELQDDIHALYDNLINNIDDILKDYA